MNTVWVVGFNGFQQIAIFCSPLQTRSSEKFDFADTGDSDSCTKITKPTKSFIDCKVDRCIITWSKIVCISEEGKAYYNGKDTVNLIECSNCYLGTCVKSDLIIGDGRGSFRLITDSGECPIKMQPSPAIDNDPRHIKQLDGTEESIFSVFGNGKVEKWKVAPPFENVASTLYREPMCLKERVTQVSCGKAHALFSSEGGTVYSFGNGSRGQLGHDTVENELEPRVIEALEGVRMVYVAAGGWHSTVISEFGDLYVWGWNESGQLGFPKSESKDYKDHSKKRKVSGTDDYRTPLKLPPPSREKTLTAAALDAETTNLNLKKCPDFVDTKSSTTYCTKTNECHKSVGVCEKQNKQDNDNFETESLSAGKFDKQKELPCLKPDTRILSSHQTKNQATSRESCSLEFPQDCEGFQFQTVPRLVELDEQMVVVKVSCGSRHTAILLDTGILLCTGWNDYGQLGLGDLESRDRFVGVPMFSQTGHRVENVFCGHWNTVVVTTNNKTVP